MDVPVKTDATYEAGSSYSSGKYLRGVCRVYVAKSLVSSLSCCVLFCILLIVFFSLFALT